MAWFAGKPEVIPDFLMLESFAEVLQASPTSSSGKMDPVETVRGHGSGEFVRAF